MRIVNLTQSSDTYTSNSYLVTGTWNTLDDVNTLVDVGRDPHVIESIGKIRNGAGQKKVAQVILTHSHYDHVSNLPLIREAFVPVVCAFSPWLEGADRRLQDGQTLKLGDKMFEVIHSPGHSSDSIQSVGGNYEDEFIQALENICRKDVRAIFPGHGPPQFGDCNGLIKTTLRNVKESMGRIKRP